MRFYGLTDGFCKEFVIYYFFSLFLVSCKGSSITFIYLCVYSTLTQFRIEIEAKIGISF